MGQGMLKDHFRDKAWGNSLCRKDGKGGDTSSFYVTMNACRNCGDAKTCAAYKTARDTYGENPGLGMRLSKSSRNRGI